LLTTEDPWVQLFFEELEYVPSFLWSKEGVLTDAIEMLRVESITDVTWNKDAFNQLVASKDTKELIQAVVTAHGQRVTSAPDIIEGKGKGLLILLHGGPGTGKTLTAESIADQQERPLYRVTCGDIGTEPAEVETVSTDNHPIPIPNLRF
jgi:transcriptional regulator with AAA-type ATPase domain